jgi:hypothetical protein
MDIQSPAIFTAVVLTARIGLAVVDSEVAIEEIPQEAEETIAGGDDPGISRIKPKMEDKVVLKETEGCIISNHTAKIAKSKGVYGYIGIETTDNEHLKLKVDMYTEYDTLKRGDEVLVKYESLGDTKILTAKEITKKKGTK